MKLVIKLDKSDRGTRYLLIGFCALALLALLLHEVFGETGYLARRQRRQQMQALAEEIEKLKQENLQLTQKVKDLRSDPHAIEQLAREQLRLGRAGEVIVTLPPSTSPTQPSRAAPSVP